MQTKNRNEAYSSFYTRCECNIILGLCTVAIGVSIFDWLFFGVIKVMEKIKMQTSTTLFWSQKFSTGIWRREHEIKFLLKTFKNKLLRLSYHHLKVRKKAEHNGVLTCRVRVCIHACGFIQFLFQLVHYVLSQVDLGKRISSWYTVSIVIYEQH